MPGRHGYSTQGGWAQGGNGISGVPATLSLSSRVSNTPQEYRASETIEFLSGFESGTGDSFETFITKDAGSTSSNSGGVYAAGGYRYGFNGKEQDPETYGDGNIYDYGFRIYNPRLGKFLSIDPLTKEYPWYTPFQFAGNTPIWATDIDGLEPAPFQMHESDRKTREYKDELRRKDPKNAEAIIRKHNINAFLIVGGGLTAGVGVVYQQFMRYAVVNTALRVATSSKIVASVSSVSTIAAKYGPDIANFVYGAVTGDATEPIPTNMGSQSADAGAAFRSLFQKGNVILDFFGGAASRFKNGVSIDVVGNSKLGSFKGTIEQFTELFRGTKFKQIIAENPWGSYNYLKSASELLEQGGTITVRGSASNKYFNKLLNGQIEGLENFTLQSKKLVEPVGKTSAGKSIESKEYYEVILKRN